MNGFRPSLRMISNSSRQAELSRLSRGSVSVRMLRMGSNRLSRTSWRLWCSSLMAMTALKYFMAMSLRCF